MVFCAPFASWGKGLAFRGKVPVALATYAGALIWYAMKSKARNQENLGDLWPLKYENRHYIKTDSALELGNKAGEIRCC
jgi:hypothetical protein